LCGYCPAGTALELNVCVECERDGAALSILQIVVGILALCVLFLVLFLAGWRHVFPENRVHAAFDKVRNIVVSLLERVATCFRKKGHKVNVDPANTRRAIQAFKIFFGYYQVVSGFIVFKVPLPDILRSTIRYLHSIGKILSFDFFEYPGLGCLVAMRWGQKLVIRTLTPIVILVLMTVPVAVSLFRLRSIARGRDQENTSPESRKEVQNKRRKARDNLVQTFNTCWNIVLSWIFLIFPSMTLASMEAFSCERIGTLQYLSADLQELCPSSSDGVFWFSIFMTAFWVVGTPTFVLWGMMHHGIPGMVDQKTRQAAVKELIDKYVADSVDSSRRKLANSIGKRVTELRDFTGDEEFQHKEFERRSADLYQTIFPDPVFPRLCATILKRILSFRGASGLTWVNIGISKPAEAQDLDHTMLSRALTQKTTFTQQEWDSFFIKDLCMNHVVKAGDSFFKPADYASETKLSLPDFKSALCKWFEDMDINLNSFLDRQELRREFQQLELSDAEADALLMHFGANEQFNIRELETGVLHILDTCIPGLKSIDVLGLYSSLPEAASNKPISLKRFEQYLKASCQETMVFTGAERAESLNGQQLLALLDHQWKRYQLDMGEGEVDEKIEAEMNVVGDKAVEALENIEADGSDPKRLEPTDEEKEMLGQCVPQLEDLCKDLEISLDNVDMNNATIRDIPKLCDAMIGALNPLLPGSLIEASANSDTSRIFSLRHKVMKIQDVFTVLLLKRVQQLALDLVDEGVITIPPLEWDGSSGPSEVNVIERLGFLLDAYHVSVWYWEVKAFPPPPPLALCRP